MALQEVLSPCQLVDSAETRAHDHTHPLAPQLITRESCIFDGVEGGYSRISGDIRHGLEGPLVDSGYIEPPHLPSHLTPESQLTHLGDKFDSRPALLHSV
jgi:hypothetical protein